MNELPLIAVSTTKWFLRLLLIIIIIVKIPAHVLYRYFTISTSSHSNEIIIDITNYNEIKGD